MKKTTSALLLALGASLALPHAPAAAADNMSDAAATSLAGLNAVYNNIADQIIATRSGETTVVKAILAVHRDMALAELNKALAPGANASATLRAAAGHIGDFATEGGPAVEPIRNRLLQAGHHHNADDTGPNAVFDEGYVVMSKKLKVEALDLGKRCAKLAESAKPAAAEITAIRDAFAALAARSLK